MADPAPKCGRCHGFALEPDTYPATPCTECKGTGRASAASPPTAQQPMELASD
jgi:DnaJ-class molecular chaperone